MNAKVLDWLRAGALLVIGAWAHSSAIHGTWLWDDDQYVTANPLLRSGAGLWHIWVSPSGVNYFPITESVRWCEWQLWGNAPWGYHLVNVITHLIGSLLVWKLAGKIAMAARGFPADTEAGSHWSPWAAGLLFAVHPICVESVAWISELKNTLSLIPLLLAACAVIEYDAHQRSRDLRRASLLFLAAMLCKSTVAMFPVIVLLYLAWKHRRASWSYLSISLPFFAVAIVLGCVTLVFEYTRAIGHSAPALEGIGTRLQAAGLSTSFYLWKSVCPWGLLPLYPRWPIEPGSLPQLLPWPLLGAVFGICWKYRQRWGRHALLALGFFVVNLLPILGLVPMAYLRLAWVADHFAYLSLVGIVIALPAAAECALGRLGGSRLLASQVILVGIALALAAGTHAYGKTFTSPEELWTYTLDRNPTAWNAWNEIAVIRCDEGRFPEAISCFQRALALHPDFPEAHNDLGVALASSGHTAEAVEEYQRAIALRPGYANAHCNLGNALLTLGHASDAVPHYLEALRLNPKLAEAHYNLGLAWKVLGREAEADVQFQEAAELGLRP